MLFEVKDILESDISSSANIVRQAFKTVADEFGLTKENASTNGAFLEDSKLLDEYNNGVKMFGLFEGEAQIGFFSLKDKDSETFYLEKLAVLPEYRHNGYGKIMINYAKEYVKRAGGKTISIGIIYENTRLKKWYETCGFEETGVKKFEHLPFTVCFMRLNL